MIRVIEIHDANHLNSLNSLTQILKCSIKFSSISLPKLVRMVSTSLSFWLLMCSDLKVSRMYPRYLLFSSYTNLLMLLVYKTLFLWFVRMRLMA